MAGNKGVPAAGDMDGATKRGFDWLRKYVDTAITAVKSAYLAKANNLSELTATASTARTNLGLGGASVLNVGTTTGTVAAGDDTRIVGAAQKAGATFTGAVNVTAGLQTNGTAGKILVYSGIAPCTTQLVTTVTTAADIVGCSLAPTLAVGDVVEVIATFDALCGTFTTNTTFVGELSYNGVTQSGGGNLRATVANQRATVGGVWLITSATAGAVTIKLTGRLAAGTAGSMTAGITSTTMIVKVYR